MPTIVALAGQASLRDEIIGLSWSAMEGTE